MTPAKADLIVAVLLLGLAAMTASKGQPFRVITTEEASIADIHAVLSKKELTVRQLVQAYLDRIKAYDCKGPAVNAIEPNRYGGNEVTNERNL